MKKSWRTLAALTTALALFGFGLASCHGGDDDDPELKLSASANTVEVGSSITITAKYDGKDVTDLAEFSSLDESKAVVELSEETAEDGTVTTVAKVTGKDSGTVEIQAKYKDTKKVKITVTPKTADSSTVAGTYSFGDSTVVIASDGTVTITSADGTATTGAVEIAENGDIIIKSSDGSTLYTAEANSDGTINTEAVTDSNGSTVSVKELEKSFDGSLFLKLDSEPAYTADSKVYVLQGTAVVDTITLDDTYNTINSSKGATGAIKVKNQLIDFDDEGNVVIVTHTDEKGYSKLYADTEYAVKIDDKVIGTYTTKAAPSIAENEISVGTDGDFATIQGALNYLRATEATGDWTINVAEGKYHERLAYYGSANVTIVGAADDNYGSKTVVDWKNMEGWNSGTTVRVNFIWQGGNLTLKNITLKSTYSRKADGTSDARNEVLNFQSNGYLVAYNSSFIGTQDTLIMGNSGGRAWFYKDYIAGDVDFIWGTLDVALFEECKILMRGDDTTSAYIFASRTVDTNKVNKGFVLYNSEVTVEDGVKAKAYYGRNSGSDTQAAVINCTFSQMLNSNLWASEATKNRNDAAGDAAIAYKDYGNKLADGTEISTAGRLALTYTMSERVVNREYNGRYAILNRGFDVEKNAYAFAETIWDISDYEAEFNASADTSKANVYVEPDYSKNIIGGNTVQLSGSSMADGVTYTYESSDQNLATVDANGLVTTVKDADGLVKITMKGSNDKTDYAQIKVISKDIPAESLSLTAEKATMARYGLQTLTIGFTPADTVDREIELTSSNENLKFYDASKKTLVDTLTTTESKVQVWAGAELSNATVTVKSVKYTTATAGKTTISTTGKDVVYHSDAAAIRMAMDIQSGNAGLWDGLVVNSKADGTIITSNGKMGMKNAGKIQIKNVFLYIPVEGACTITIGHSATVDSSKKYTIGDGTKEFATEDNTTFTYDYDGTDTTGVVLGSTLSSLTFAKQAGADIVATAKYLKVNAVGADRYITAITIGELGATPEEPTNNNPSAATLTVPWTVNITDSETKKYGAAAVEFGAFAGTGPYSTKTDGQSYTLNQNVDGLYYYSDANGLMDGDNGGIGFNYYATNSDAVAAVGGTATPKTYIELKAAQLAKEGATSIKLTINAKWKEASDKVGVHSYIALLEGSKVLALSEPMSDTAADYTFYVKPSTTIKIMNGGVKGTHMYIYSIKTESSDHAVTADGTVAITGITLSASGVDADNSITLQSTGNVVLSASVTPSTATPVELEWRSSDTSVTVTPASDTKSATVTYSAGKTPIITVSDKNGSASAAAAITFNTASNAIQTIQVANANIDLYSNENPKATLNAVISPADTDTDGLTWQITEGDDIISFTSATAAATSATSAVTIGTTNATSSIDVFATGKAGTAKVKVSGGNVTDQEVTVTVSASAVTNGKYDFNKDASVGGLRDSLVAGATSIPDGSFRWNENGLATSNSSWISTSATTEMEIDVAGPTVVSFESFGGTQYNAAMTVTEGTNTLVQNVKSTDTAIAFLYSGTTPTTLKIAFGGAHYFRSVTISDGTGKTNSVAVKLDGDTSVAVNETIELTATLTNAYINTDSIPVQTVSWTPTSSEYFTITISSDTLTATIKGTATTTENITVTATSDATATSNASKSIEVTATAATTVDSTWQMGELGCYSDASFGTSTGKTEVNAGTAYIKGSNSKIALYVDATSGKLSQNASGYAQMNKDTKIYVPVSAGSVITVNCRDSSYGATSVPAGLTVGGVAQDTTTTVFNVGNTASDGYVLITTSDEKDYLISIAVTGVNPNPDTARSISNLVTAVTKASN